MAAVGTSLTFILPFQYPRLCRVGLERRWHGHGICHSEDVSVRAANVSERQQPSRRAIGDAGGTHYYTEPGVTDPTSQKTYGVSELQGLKATRIFDPSVGAHGAWRNATGVETRGLTFDGVALDSVEVQPAGR